MRLGTSLGNVEELAVRHLQLLFHPPLTLGSRLMGPATFPPHSTAFSQAGQPRSLPRSCGWLPQSVRGQRMEEDCTTSGSWTDGHAGHRQHPVQQPEFSCLLGPVTCLPRWSAYPKVTHILLCPPPTWGSAT